MKNRLVAEKLRELGDLLEAQDVEWKPRAYRRAADTVESLDGDVADLDEEELMELPGIGESIAKKIREISETGRLSALGRLKEELPVAMEELTVVEGIGPRTARRLYEGLGVKDLDGLERAASEGDIRELSGFGERSEEKILEGIAFARRARERELLGVVLPVVAREMEEALASLEETGAVDVAGSIRRRRETVGDVDLLAVSSDPVAVMDAFVSTDDVSDVLQEGETRSSVRLDDGLEVDLRIVEEESYGSAMMYFTGSKEHNVAVRTHAIGLGYKLNEYGLFRDDERISGGTEEEVYGKLDMQFVPPELREDRGEVEAALEGELPELLDYGGTRGDLHVHTESSDGSNTAREMAEAAAERGLEYVCVSDHTGEVAITTGQDAGALLKQREELRELNDELEGIEVLSGVEVDVLKDGSLDVEAETLDQLDCVTASVHSGFDMEEDQMTDRIVSALRDYPVHVLGHPTGRKIRKRKPYAVDLGRVFEVALEEDVAMEVNSFPERLDLRDVDVKEAVEVGVKLAVNTDAHRTAHFRNAEFGEATARRGWATSDDVVNAWPLDELRRWLGRER
ncbi:MAG: phosphatase YcdX [Methanonatronarchaeales archaeon]|nr:phosphatase YcdX [Methanonatronarchaeales archaeon]